ncbi:MAG TPA: hypothetical protein VGC87_21405 [Pyrinomonadaceae bacterium]|jgi:hypothetical protein
MTGEEMERAIEVLRQSGARCDAQLERTKKQAEQLGRQLQASAKTHSKCIQILKTAIQTLSEVQARADKGTDER